MNCSHSTVIALRAFFHTLLCGVVHQGVHTDPSPYKASFLQPQLILKISPTPLYQELHSLFTNMHCFSPIMYVHVHVCVCTCVIIKQQYLLYCVVTASCCAICFPSYREVHHHHICWLLHVQWNVLW